MERARFLGRYFLILIVAIVSFQVQAGGRYQDPPENLNEVLALSSKALEMLKQGDTDEALAATAEARKLAKESNKMKTTAPMQKSSSQLRMAKSALKKGKTDKASDLLAQVVTLLTEVKKSYE